MMDKVNCFFRSLYDAESNNGKTLRNITMGIMRFGIWMISYAFISILWSDYLGFDSDVIHKMDLILIAGGGIFLSGSYINLIFKKDGSIYDGKTIKQNDKGE